MICKTFCGPARVLCIVAFLTAGSSFAFGQTVADGLIGHWKFEEGTGDLVKDSSGNGNDGLIVPFASPQAKWGVGVFAGAASFSAANDHFVRIPASPSLNTIRKQITVVAFIYPRTLWSPIDRYISFVQRKWEKAVQFTGRLMGSVSNKMQDSSPTGYIAVVQRQWKETIHPDQFYLGYGLENNVLQYKWHLGLLDDDEVSLYRLPEGQARPRVKQWVHLVGTYNGETGTTSLYVDGEKIGTTTRAGTIRLDQESLGRPLAIGAELNGPSTTDPTAQFDGYIRDVRIYNRSLSDEEVKTLAANAKRQVRR